MMGKLSISEPRWAILLPDGRRWRRVLVARRMVLGSGPGATVLLKRSQVSSQHCRVRLVEGQVQVTDLGSEGGTTVAGRRLDGRPVSVDAGAVVRLAGVPIVFAHVDLRSGQPWLTVGELGSASARMWTPMARLCVAARTDWPVLICGETGTGKELAARLLHDRSTRQRRPFVRLNCAALNPGTLQAELFGSSRGAYTGSVAERSGAFGRADLGTLFLDEIGELSAAGQAALLRVLETGEVQVVGGPARQVDVRVVAATHRHLASEVIAGRFREDLLHRLAVTEVTLPPLRQRGRDAAILLARILPGWRWPDGGESLLCRQRWTGNVRQLINLSRRLSLGAGYGAPTIEDLCVAMDTPKVSHGPVLEVPAGVDKVELVAKLVLSEPSVSAAWRRSGMGRSTFYRHLKQVRLRQAKNTDVGSVTPELAKFPVATNWTRKGIVDSRSAAASGDPGALMSEQSPAKMAVR